MKMAEEVSLPVRLLRLLSAGGILSTSELAQKLGVSCSLAVACSVRTARDRLPLLALTPRGRQMAAS